jgi:hypothetical protein
MLRRLSLAPEDLALAAWNAAAVPILATGVAAPVLRLGDAPNPLAGWVQLLSVLGAIIAIGTRPAMPLPEPIAEAEVRGSRLAFIGPLFAGIAFVAGSAATYLGTALDGPVVGVAFLVTIGAVVLGSRLPVMPAPLRRAVITPFILVCAGIFDSFAAELLRDVDLAGLIGSLAVDETGFGLFIVFMLVGGLGTFYAALVVAPRLLVGEDTRMGCLVWPARFVLFLLSAALGIGWLTAVAG